MCLGTNPLVLRCVANDSRSEGKGQGGSIKQVPLANRFESLAPDAPFVGNAARIFTHSEGVQARLVHQQRIEARDLELAWIKLLQRGRHFESEFGAVQGV